jgi:hypothetical protein
MAEIETLVSWSGFQDPNKILQRTCHSALTESPKDVQIGPQFAGPFESSHMNIK